MGIGAGTAMLISAGVSAAAGGASIAQGAKTKREQRRAEAAAEKAMNEAKEKAKIDFMEGLQIPTEAYDRAFKSTVAQQQQAITALQESDPRALAAGVGKVQAAGVEASAKTREAMAEDLYKNELLKVQAQEKVKQDLMDLDLGEARGAQIAASQAGQQAAQSFTQSIQGLTQAGLTLYQGSDLYSKNKEQEKEMNKLKQDKLFPNLIPVDYSSLLDFQVPRHGLLTLPGLTNSKTE